MDSFLTSQPLKSLSEIIFDIGKYVEVVEQENKRLKEKVSELEMQDKNQRILDAMPDVLVAQDIADYLHIGRSKVYNLFQKSNDSGGIKCFGSGRSVRCMKSDFVAWLEREKSTKEKRLA